MHGDARNAVVSLGGLIIDDVAIPGQTLRRDLLGGSGVHAAFGMGMATKALAANDVESFIVAKIGFDFKHADELMKAGVSTCLVETVNGCATPHALQDFTEGRRKHIWLTPKEEFVKYFRMSTVYLHLLHYPVDDILDCIRESDELFRIATRVLWEPVPTAFKVENMAQLRRISAIVDIFSPSLEECALIMPEVEECLRTSGYHEAALIALRTVCTWCQKTIILRVGEAGTYLRAEDGQRVLYTPAISVQAVDSTGAGNSFCGAYLVALASGEDLQKAVAIATACASITVEQYGVPAQGLQRTSLILERAAHLQKQQQWFSL